MAFDVKKLLSSIELPASKPDYADGFLYMVYSSSGIAKVGFSQSPHMRIRALAREFASQGMAVDDIRVTPLTRSARLIEMRAIELMSISFDGSKGREYFNCKDPELFWSYVTMAIQEQEDKRAKFRKEIQEAQAQARIKKLKRERPQRVINDIVLALIEDRPQGITA